MVSLPQLKTLRAVAEHRSMTRAAAELDLSVSAVSTHITALSKSLGCTLLRRNHDGYDLTDAGRRVLRSSEVVFAHIELIRGVRHAEARRPAGQRSQTRL